MSVIVVVPAFNEADRIAKMVLAIKQFADHVVVVDDGSEDLTSIRAQEAGAIVLRHIINCGPGAATQTGLAYAKLSGADFIATMDGDGQHEPHDLIPMLEYLRTNNKDIVFGSRFMKANHVPLLRRLANMIGNFVTFLLSGIWLTDSQTGFKIFTAKALKHIEVTANGFEFCSEIVREVSTARLSYGEFPITVYYSEDTMAKGQNIATGLTTVFKLIVRSLMR